MKISRFNLGKFRGPCKQASNDLFPSTDHLLLPMLTVPYLTVLFPVHTSIGLHCPTFNGLSSGEYPVRSFLSSYTCDAILALEVLVLWAEENILESEQELRS